MGMGPKEASKWRRWPEGKAGVQRQCSVRTWRRRAVGPSINLVEMPHPASAEGCIQPNLMGQQTWLTCTSRPGSTRPRDACHPNSFGRFLVQASEGMIMKLKTYETDRPCIYITRTGPTAVPMVPVTPGCKCSITSVLCSATHKRRFPSEPRV
jgi:hypothetical protein